MKKQIRTTLGIAAAYTGTLFGAGFVSGQEILRFFASWGGKGIFGALLAGAGFAALGIMVMQIVRQRGTADFERVICPVDGLLPKIVSIMMSVWLFGIVTVMLSAASELFSSLTGLNGFIGAALLTVILIVINLAGANGLASVFSLVVPIMILVGLSTAVMALITGPSLVFTAAPAPDFTVAPHWLFSAVLYMSYNILACIGVLGPLGRDCEDKRTANLGAIIGGAIPGLFAAVLCAAMLASHDAAFSADMPMFETARAISPALGFIYALSLFAGIFTAAAGISFSILNRLSSIALPGILKKRTVTVPLVCVLALVGSRLGFASLVSTVYPIYGYIGFVVIALMLVNLIKSRKVKAEAEA